jgi:hypothetical protein
MRQNSSRRRLLGLCSTCEGLSQKGDCEDPGVSSSHRPVPGIATIGGVEVVVKVMETFSNCQTLQEFACNVILNLAAWHVAVAIDWQQESRRSGWNRGSACC